MSHQIHRPVELTYGATRAIDRLTAAAEALRGVIMREVTDPEARSAALGLVASALAVAVRGVATY